MHFSNEIFASVRVPVLSVQSTSIDPRFWMAPSRLTITRRLAIRIAPRESVTEMTMGSSSGVRPTASAIANRKESSNGRCRPTLTRMTNSTRNSVILMIIIPKRWIATSKAVGGGSI